jgi:D-3-phosphoglycerate dehydrogenase
VLVSLAHSKMFDDRALAEALTTGALAAAWFDSMEPGLLDPGRPLRHIDTLQVMPRVAATTQGSRVRSAWAVARRVDELLSVSPPRSEFRGTLPDEFADLADDPGPA